MNFPRACLQPVGSPLCNTARHDESQSDTGRDTQVVKGLPQIPDRKSNTNACRSADSAYVACDSQESTRSASKVTPSRHL